MNNSHPRPRCEMVNLAYYQNWLIEDAWPVWLEHGVDWEKRAFVEYLDPNTFECNAKFRRLRVVTRQIISFSQAFSNNISRSEEAVHLGIEFLINSAKLESGGYARTFDLDNQAIDKTLDLYDHAFVLLAFASAAKIANLENLRTRALELLVFILENFRHNNAGFIESIPITVPRRQNPHMHFLEALLANYEVFGDEIFIDTAKDIVELFLEKFLCPATGAIAEYFEDDLSIKLYSNRYTVEPGHIFEWVWLLQKFDNLLQKDAVGEFLHNPIYKKLFEYTDNYAINNLNGLVFDELSSDGKVLSHGSRIWPQTERIRAEIHCRQGNTKQQIQALQSFKVYISNIPRGLWHEQFDRNGISSFPVSRATTLYHLTTGFFSCLSW